MGFGAFVASSPHLLQLALWGGAAFLFVYGLRSFRAVLRGEVLEAGSDSRSFDGAGSVIVAALGLSLLNPHVYLDTVLLLGSLAGQHAGDARIFFAVGAVAASLAWFYGLGYGARVLTPLFRTPVAWRILDGLVGCTMWGIAGSLIWKQVAAG
jgi:L-lysine exporter family protein LysE/ArgO